MLMPHTQSNPLSPIGGFLFAFWNECFWEVVLHICMPQNNAFISDFGIPMLFLRPI